MYEKNIYGKSDQSLIDNIQYMEPLRVSFLQAECSPSISRLA